MKDETKFKLLGMFTKHVTEPSQELASIKEVTKKRRGITLAVEPKWISIPWQEPTALVHRAALVRMKVHSRDSMRYRLKIQIPKGAMLTEIGTTVDACCVLITSIQIAQEPYDTMQELCPRTGIDLAFFSTDDFTCPFDFGDEDVQLDFELLNNYWDDEFYLLLAISKQFETREEAAEACRLAAMRRRTGDPHENAVMVYRGLLDHQLRDLQAAFEIESVAWQDAEPSEQRTSALAFCEDRRKIIANELTARAEKDRA